MAEVQQVQESNPRRGSDRDPLVDPSFFSPGFYVRGILCGVLSHGYFLSFTLLLFCVSHPQLCCALPRRFLLLYALNR